MGGFVARLVLMTVGGTGLVVILALCWLARVDAAHRVRAELVAELDRIDAQLGEGAWFVVELDPCSVPVRTPDATPDPSAIEARRTACATVLLVEDNPANQALVRAACERRPDLKLLVAPDAARGLALARAHAPALVLLDRHLPDLDGHGVHAELRGDEDLRDTPVVVITADASPRQERRARELGALALLTKPIDVSQLLELVDRVVEESTYAFC